MKGPETARAENRRKKLPLYSFFGEYMGGTGLDIGYKGSLGDQAEPVLPDAIGVDEDYPGYKDNILPFPDESQDYVYSSHCLEHVRDPMPLLRDWYRVTKTGGYIIIAVPHRDLYERKYFLPSIWNRAHKRFYTPASLLAELEAAYEPNSYRVRHLQDCDEGYNYELAPPAHPKGEYQIECVLQKIKKPDWRLG